MTDAVSEAPERLWTAGHGPDDDDAPHTVEYVRADLLLAAEAARDAAQAERDKWRSACLEAEFKLGELDREAMDLAAALARLRGE